MIFLLNHCIAILIFSTNKIIPFACVASVGCAFMSDASPSVGGGPVPGGAVLS